MCRCVYKIYYKKNELDGNFQTVNLNVGTSTLPQISISSTSSPVYNLRNQKRGNIYYTTTNYSDKTIANGTIDFGVEGSISYSFIAPIQIINNETIIPTGTITKTNIISGTGSMSNKTGYVKITYLPDSRLIKIVMW